MHTSCKHDANIVYASCKHDEVIMSAPFKQGLSYFSHDIDMSEDPKVEYLEVAHGLIGYAVFIKLLEKIYRNGYYTNWDERDVLIFSKKNNIEQDKCHEIVVDCLREGIFDEDIYNHYNVLTSHGIQARYLKSCERRKNINLISEYLIVDIKWINVNINSLTVTIKDLNGNIILVNVAESKVKKSKVKKSNNSFQEDSAEYQLSNFLFSLILKNNPGAKKPNLQSWAKNIDLMIRVDNRKPEDVRNVIEWCQKDNFWQTNILSAKKLREKYDQLTSKMKNGSKSADDIYSGMRMV